MSEGRVRRTFALLIAAAGLLDLASALSRPFPERMHAISRVVPLAVPHVANILVVQAGVLLLFIARQLYRGKRRAWEAAVVLATAGAALHVVKGLDVEEASVSAALAVGLVMFRRHFRAQSDAPSFRLLLRRGPVLVAVPFVYGILGVYLERGRAARPFGLRAAATEVAYRLIGIAGPLEQTALFRRWFPASITVMAVVIGAYLIFLAFRPVVRRGAHRTTAQDDAMRGLVRAGSDTLGYFLLRDDKAAHFGPDGRAALGFDVVGGVALVSGDPAGPRDAWPVVVADFGRTARELGRRVAAIGLSEDAASVWADLGYRVLYLGDEAVIDPRTFSLDGRPMRKVRQACTRVERDLYTVEWFRVAEVGPDLRRALLHVSQAWLHGDEERGFSMTLGRLFDDRDPDCLVAVARDVRGYARGFLHFVPAGAAGYSLDVMRRDRDTPPGLSEFMIARTLEHLAASGVRLVSLNFAFLRGVIRPAGRLRPTQRLQRWLALRLGPWFQIESLYRFNNKFGPEWRPRFGAFESSLSLPAVALAALRAEKLIDVSLLRPRRSRVEVPA